jgi:hypothetical protein
MNMSVHNPGTRKDQSAVEDCTTETRVESDHENNDSKSLNVDNRHGGLDSSDSNHGLSGNLNMAPNLSTSKNSPTGATANYSTVANEMKTLLNRFNFRQKSKESKQKMKIKSKDRKHLKDEVLGFMRGIMDQCTHLVNFSVPVDPSLVIIVTAEKDAYMPRDKVTPMEDLWPGVEVRYLKNGHITSFLFHQNDFRYVLRGIRCVVKLVVLS